MLSTLAAEELANSDIGALEDVLTMGIPFWDRRRWTLDKGTEDEDCLELMERDVD